MRHTILNQMGRQFVVMTGASQMLTNAEGTEFQCRIGSGANKGINKVRITLAADDTYTVRFYRIRRGRSVDGLTVELVAEFDGVYADGLRGLFERQTGMLTRM